MTTSSNLPATLPCDRSDVCGLVRYHTGHCRPVRTTPLSRGEQALTELFDWLPEWLVCGGFFFGSLLASGWLSFVSMTISVFAAVWILANRSARRRRNERVLREYDADLVEADARALADREGAQ